MMASILHPWKLSILIRDIKELSEPALARYVCMVGALFGFAIFTDPTWFNFSCAFIITTHVFLMSERKLSTFAWGCVGAVLYMGLLAYHGLWLPFVVSIVTFLIPSIIGAYVWVNHMAGNCVKVRSRETLKPEHKVLLDLILALCLFIAIYLQYLHLVPTAAGFSLVASVFSIMRLKDQWWVWMMMGLAGVVLWGLGNERPDNLFFAGMYALIVLQSVDGWVNWKNAQPKVERSENKTVSL